MAAQNNYQVDALLVGYENQENLGLRSIMAYLHAHNYRAMLIPFFPDQEDKIFTIVQQVQPRLVGFSLIFQYTLDEFGKLMRYLRANGVAVHFTAGGHFPSLCPQETLDFIPELDTVVRSEGELTLLELLNHLDQPQQWEYILGLAFRQGTKTVLTPLRPLITDLDSLPLVYRDEPRQLGNGVLMASMLASRGCLFDCSFCSIRQFYGSTQGALRRIRSPQAVVDEMLMLFTEKAVRFFAFQDDDFAARTPRQREWIQAFLQALAKTGLAHQVRWKISCRVDDVEPETLEAMLNHGLITVYLGVESGNEVGLSTLNKHVSVEQNLATIDLLKRYDVGLAIGFMLFDPSSTVNTIRENIEFLRIVGEDGYFPINFCKMLPYAGTPIEAQLRKAGRLKGTVTKPDYDFLDPQLDWYAFLVQRIFTQRNFSPDGIVTCLQQANFDYRLSCAFEPAKLPDSYKTTLRQITSQSNKLALETLSILLDEIISHGIDFLLNEQKTFLGLAEREWRGEAEIKGKLTNIGALAVR